MFVDIVVVKSNNYSMTLPTQNSGVDLTWDPTSDLQWVEGCGSLRMHSSCVSPISDLG